MTENLISRSQAILNLVDDLGSELAIELPEDATTRDVVNAFVAKLEERLPGSLGETIPLLKLNQANTNLALSHADCISMLDKERQAHVDIIKGIDGMLATHALGLARLGLGDDFEAVDTLEEFSAYLRKLDGSFLLYCNDRDFDDVRLLGLCEQGLFSIDLTPEEDLDGETNNNTDSD